MTNVVPFKAKELEYCGYYDLKGDLGLVTKDESLAIIRLNTDEFEFHAHGNVQIYKRNELAEFLKVAAILIDSEDRWLPDLELIGMNYED